MSLGIPYQLTETKFTYQGIGLGGNSMFNGMLFQTNPIEVFDRSWPTRWSWADSRPYLAASSGRRAGPISGYFGAIDPGGVPVSGLEILPYSKAARIEFDAQGAAQAVQYLRRDALDQSRPASRGTARLRPGGVLIMAAGALVTPRLLLLSGVGPRGREAEIFPGQSPAPFVIDNRQVGVGVFDHVMTMVTYSYNGPVPYRAYNYGNYPGNSSDLQAYLAGGSGPYAQYQPVDRKSVV